MTPRILVAGIGNIFFGDDAFGVEVTRHLLRGQLSDGVRVIDFGIRSYDLTYTLADGWDMVILVDAVERGGAPGTLYLIEPDEALSRDDGAGREEIQADVPQEGHGLNPALSLRMARAMGGAWKACYLVGCQPATLETEDGEIGLSVPVLRAVPDAADVIRGLIDRYRGCDREDSHPVATTLNNQQEG